MAAARCGTMRMTAGAGSTDAVRMSLGPCAQLREHIAQAPSHAAMTADSPANALSVLRWLHP
ncbi:hypothetical protein P3T18_005771 [Paraburkholderia sp. GAS199]